VWPTFDSYLLAVHLRRGKVVRAYAEPLIIESYTPKGLTGELADYVAREAAGREPGSFLVEDGAMEVDLRGTALRSDRPMPLRADSADGDIFRLGKGCYLSGFRGPGRVQPGRDLLWVGSFEDEVASAAFPRAAPLWDFDGLDRSAGAAFAYRGDAGARLRRGSEDLADAVLTPLHRFLVQPGTQLSVTGRVRSSRSAGVKLQMSWYPDTEGPSSNQTVVSLGGDRARWRPFRLDVTVPPGAVAGGLYLRLAPPERGQRDRGLR
jgi:poly-gamma-glutamate synthesis protein (capsule biosynthesis protein)